MRVLAIEPFYGGSHRQFLDQWIERSRHGFDLVTFPDRHWKWRMRHSALSAARQVAGFYSSGRRWDVLFCSSMLPLAELRGLSDVAAALPSILYFHENQLTYPTQDGEEHNTRRDNTKNDSGATTRHNSRDAHFAYTQFVSACAATELWFNSDFHRAEWLDALSPFLQRFPDFSEVQSVKALGDKAKVQWPGVEAPVVERAARNVSADSDGESDADSNFEITWAARWEHDKNPQDFFDALRELEKLTPGSSWKVNIVGQGFRQVPPCFDSARESLGPRIRSWGFVPRAEYLEVLRRSRVFVSTAIHEFFGLSVVEAMLAGTRPLLPDRLSYPELVDGNQDFLYDGSVAHLSERLAELLKTSDRRLPRHCDSSMALAERFSWDRRLEDLDQSVERVGSS